MQWPPFVDLFALAFALVARFVSGNDHNISVISMASHPDIGASGLFTLYLTMWPEHTINDLFYYRGSNSYYWGYIGS